MPSAQTVRRLLDELHAEQMAVPDELQVERDLRDVRFDLERIALQLAQVDKTFDRGELLSDLDSTTDAQLEVLLEVDGDWIDVGGSCWRVRDVAPSASGAAGAAHLREPRKKSAAPVSP